MVRVSVLLALAGARDPSFHGQKSPIPRGMNSMPENPDSRSAKEWRTPLWAWIVVALIAAGGFGALKLLGGGRDEINLPPGFTITTGEDSGGDASERSPSPSQSHWVT